MIEPTDSRRAYRRRAIASIVGVALVLTISNAVKPLVVDDAALVLYAEQIAKMRNVSPDVLREIGRNRQFVKRYTVAHELVKNPKTPHAVSSKLMTRLKDRDLRRLMRDRNVSEMVRRLAGARIRSKK